MLVICCAAVALAGSGIREKLRRIPQISGIEEIRVEPFQEYYCFWFEQAVDHNDASKGTFKQRVLLGHLDMKAPVVAELEGYGLEGKEAGELSGLLHANQLTVEHRFFEQSVPQGRIPWEYLTIRQAAADQHEIIRALKAQLYTDNKWISTGISKGGQAAIFHRYFYPEDVDVSVPYVAPLNLEEVDPRLQRFLDKLGIPKRGLEAIFGGGSAQRDCHWAVRDFQLLCFRNFGRLLPLFREMAEERRYTFELAGGVDRALQLVILEYPFAFWQWGNSCEGILSEDESTWKEILEYLTNVSPPAFFEDHAIVKMYPFFYAALTETGMYDYSVKPFRKFLHDEKNLDFSFAFPKDAVRKPFDAAQMKAVRKWLQSDAERILFVYGGSDPWYATAVDLKNNWKCRKYVRGDMGHTCRIRDFDPVSREDLIDTLKEWLKE